MDSGTRITGGGSRYAALLAHAEGALYGTELGSVTLKRVGLFCFPIKHSTHTCSAGRLGFGTEHTHVREIFGPRIQEVDDITCVCVRVRVYVCLCVCARARFLFQNPCAGVCVDGLCAFIECVRERERARVRTVRLHTLPFSLSLSLSVILTLSRPLPITPPQLYPPISLSFWEPHLVSKSTDVTLTDS